tara:strand:+ start:889 stop:1320 length:432 start_codon:yes stop_codon:yes gene_type:complete
MSNLNIKNSPRDIRINRKDEAKYKYLKERLKAESDKEIFKLAFRMGFFKELKEPLKPKPKHMWQFSTFLDNIQELMLIARYQKEDVEKIFDGKEIAKECEEYANGGINYLYKLFMEGNKEDIYIIEDILEDLKKLIKNSLIFI